MLITIEDANTLLRKLSEDVQFGGPSLLTPKQYRLLAEMVPMLNKLRSAHVKDCVVNNHKTFVELETMWNVPKDWVQQFMAIHIPHKRYRYMGMSLPVYAGTNYLAFDSDGVIWAFGIKPEAGADVWHSSGSKYKLSQIHAVPTDNWASSLRAVTDLHEVQNDPQY